MTSHDEPGRVIGALHERISRLGTASLRIADSPDLETLLGEALEAALALSGARAGAIAALDGTGQTREFATSGFQQSPARPRSPGESPAEPTSDGIPRMPLRHRGVDVGYLVLGEKEGEFTDEDRELLLPIASQAAAAIAAARAQGDAGRVRADLEAVVETAPVGVVVFKAETGDVLSINLEAKRIVEGLRTAGHSSEQLLKVIALQRADGREIDLAQSPLAGVLQGAETVRGEEILVSTPDGRSATILVNVTPVRSADGPVVSVIVTMQDLEPIRELERLRSEFLGLVSHELRAPLTSIKGSAATLLETASDLDPAVMREYFRIISDQVDHMHGLINDLLDAGRIDAGRMSVLPEPSKVSALVERARSTFLSGGGRNTVLIDLPPDLPRVMADGRRIVQVLNNLFANAARHAPESSPIRVVAQRDGVHVAISVIDKGRGVAPERLRQLFQKYTGAGDRAHGLSGTGLGLAICKGLVEAHGGRIRAESGGMGQGTQLIFTLPVADETGSGSAAAPDRPARGRDAPEKPAVLVVDDDPQVLHYVRDVLSQAGYSPIVTGDHRELAQVIRRERPALVMLDLILPETDGIELMESIPELVDLPVIFISAYGRDETIVKALEAGADDYVVKPFSATELTARIGAALRRRAKPEPFVLGELAIHYDERRVSLARRTVELTASEYELLHVLSLNAGRVVGYETLLRQVSGKRHDDSAKAALRTLAKGLRRKLGDDGRDPAYILTERGIGYRMPRPGRP
ncbi:MAG: response regulator [Defluviicoccus sp.]|nr:response regulator [Defluviicoccus sp.]